VKQPEAQFEVGDRVKSVLRSGEIVILTTTGPVLNVSFGPKGDLAATVNARQIVEKLPLIN
jgi:hypothetical protein